MTHFGFRSGIVTLTFELLMKKITLPVMKLIAYTGNLNVPAATSCGLDKRVQSVHCALSGRG